MSNQVFKKVIFVCKLIINVFMMPLLTLLMLISSCKNLLWANNISFLQWPWYKPRPQPTLHAQTFTQFQHRWVFFFFIVILVQDKSTNSHPIRKSINYRNVQPCHQPDNGCWRICCTYYGINSVLKINHSPQSANVYVIFLQIGLIQKSDKSQNKK